MAARLLFTTRKQAPTTATEAPSMSIKAKLPITALLPALVAVAGALNLGGKVLEDGKADLKDLPSVIGALGELSALTTIKVGQAAKEALDLDDAEHAEVLKAFKVKFDLKDDAPEAAVELYVDAALQALVAYAKSKEATAILFPSAQVA